MSLQYVLQSKIYSNVYVAFWLADGNRSVTIEWIAMVMMVKSYILTLSCKHASARFWYRFFFFLPPHFHAWPEITGLMQYTIVQQWLEETITYHHCCTPECVMNDAVCSLPLWPTLKPLLALASLTLHPWLVSLSSLLIYLCILATFLFYSTDKHLGA